MANKSTDKRTSKSDQAINPNQENPMIDVNESTGKTVDKEDIPKMPLDIIKLAYKTGNKLDVKVEHLKKIGITSKIKEQTHKADIGITDCKNECCNEEKTLKFLADTDWLLKIPPNILIFLAKKGNHLQPKAQRSILKYVLGLISQHELFKNRQKKLDDESIDESIIDDISAKIDDYISNESNRIRTKGKNKEKLKNDLENNISTTVLLYRLLYKYIPITKDRIADKTALSEFTKSMSKYIWDTSSNDKGGISKAIDVKRLTADAAKLVGKPSKDQLAILVNHYENEARSLREYAKAQSVEADKAREIKKVAQEENERIGKDLERMQQTLQIKDIEICRLQQAIADEKNLRTAEEVIHVDDYEGLRTRTIRRLSAQVDLLNDGLHALRNGSYSVAEEFMDRALNAIQNEVKTLQSGSGAAK